MRVEPIKKFQHGNDSISSSLLATRPGLAFIASDRMQHDLDRVLRRIMRVAPTPVVGYSVCEDVAVSIECGGANGTADLGVSFQSVLCVLVPEVEGPIA